jgi:hypothetical protein
MTYEQFADLVSKLYQFKQNDSKYLEGMPSDVREFVATNRLAESLYAQIDLGLSAAFGSRWPDVQWFLQDWKPGFHIKVKAPGPTPFSKTSGIESMEDYLVYPKTFVIESLEDYLAYAKEQLFSKA